jgi:hypothetical protein
MQTSLCILIWFCIGWTTVTFPVLLAIVVLAVGAKISDAAHKKSMRELLCEKKQDTESKQ